MSRLVYAVATLGLAVVSCVPGPRAGSTYVVLANPKSGPQAGLGREISRALDLVRDRLRESNPKNIEIVEVDTESVPAVARAEILRAARRWHAPIVVGSILSAETREFLAEALDLPIVVIANGSSDPGIRALPFRKPWDGFFRNWPADDFEGRVMAEYLRSTNRATTLVVIHASDPYPAALANAFSRRFQELGGQVLGPEVYPTTITAFDALIRRQPASGHDGYYVVGFPRDLAGIYDTLRRNPETARKPFYSAVGINTGEFSSLVRSELDQVFFTTPAVDEAVGPYFAFRQAYSARFAGESPDIVTPVSYDALMIAIDAIENADTTPESLRKYLYSRPPFPGVSGPTGFDSLGDVVTKGVAINFFENGRRLLGEVRFAAESQ